MAIQSFKDEVTHDLFHGIETKKKRKFKELEKIMIGKDYEKKVRYDSLCSKTYRS